MISVKFVIIRTDSEESKENTELYLFGVILIHNDAMVSFYEYIAEDRLHEVMDYIKAEYVDLEFMGMDLEKLPQLLFDSDMELDIMAQHGDTNMLYYRRKLR